MEQYSIVLHTSLGPRQGLLSLEANGPALHGDFFLLNHHNATDGRYVDAQTFNLYGTLQGLYNALTYTMTCIIHGESIQGDMTTPKGQMRLTGCRNGA